ncbi:MAG: pentapeptide repeat-containing protein [Candidatus Parabeggiatoa sp.]|nr:pentapeptide repeat-containing protein [Candidatus Parabeggiatoa sp.]
MKKLTAYLFIVLLMSLLAPVTVAYDPDDLMRLIRTKSCVGCDLSGANLNRYFRYDFLFYKRFNFKGANLEEANLEEANLYRADLIYANLQGANLEGANLERAKLYRANLEGANLQKADLTRADLWRANLENANLQEAKLYETDFFKTKLLNTIVSKSEFAKRYPRILSEPDILSVKFPVETIAVERSGHGYWNKFRAFSGKGHEIKVNNTNSKADIVIKLYDSSLNLLKTVDKQVHGKSEKFVWTAPKSDKDYYVNITGTHLDEDSYKLQVYELFDDEKTLPFLPSKHSKLGDTSKKEPPLNGREFPSAPPIIRNLSLEDLLKEAKATRKNNLNIFLDFCIVLL